MAPGRRKNIRSFVSKQVSAVNSEEIDHVAVHRLGRDGIPRFDLDADVICDHPNQTPVGILLIHVDNAVHMLTQVVEIVSH
jgi:hypothetical protein